MLNWIYKYTSTSVPESSFLQFFRDNGYGIYGYPLVGGYHYGQVSGYYGYVFAGY